MVQHVRAVTDQLGAVNGQVRESGRDLQELVGGLRS
ncbi:hypothetical protein BC739_001441 [Kutzneria viridogrisea]|uniref:WXG100 family type VII secretion target n=1 Tax=Kutzneria viridogrisea TaxID=47990 RepID=A0ABR6BBJ5_9PSEU|nr:hypothetical protein [Kutzneria viridogrisea]